MGWSARGDGVGGFVGVAAGRRVDFVAGVELGPGTGFVGHVR